MNWLQVVLIKGKIRPFLSSYLMVNQNATFFSVVKRVSTYRAMRLDRSKPLERD
jgi:hypothetical protein